ncbi:MAG TPA: O-succinylhomoserine sulfhydrylase [Pseudomonadales bacterium]|jgi:O-succinylhomoserine sulfhydrylase|nr:O-succinylhomoserine sulfhydrylase [Pseudomonadales bacterium]HNL91425.1 O-succinylhomoserine sulfhydrylase [Pseudomonadales bacterium]HNN86016.1 O-succinylhomoserine sulfhydrylase [Pseudomonadales bacterium]
MRDKNKHSDDWSFETLGVRAGFEATAFGEHSEPLFLTSSYVFDSAEQAAARFAGTDHGNVYSRYTNPTVAVFEQRLAALEGGEMAVATASGMAAILATCMALLKSGDHVVCSRSVFGTTTALFTRYLQKFGVEVSFVTLVDMASWQQAIQKNTKLFFLETPSNPLNEIADVAAIADLAHKAGALLVVDNCFCSPALQQPLKLGADIVVHSATKYIDGQGRCLGGAVVGAKKYLDDVMVFLRTTGPTLSAFNAWVMLKGLETLALRMREHCRNALAVAQWLEKQDGIESVHYCGLSSHPQHALAKQQQPGGFGGVLSFAVKGDKAAAWRFINATNMVSLTANLGDAKTTIVHPATTTHGRLTPEERAQAGIGDNLIRLSVGLESLVDIQADMQRGLSAL